MNFDPKEKEEDKVPETNQAAGNDEGAEAAEETTEQVGAGTLAD